ncbi:MAG TPA: universal stress protein [Firmicutes bacterium]|jgi:nucleotide-binding universal stress UspA family protein|nr:universal stress protein [Bacillota bacterium]
MYKILVATDGSDHSWRTFVEAVKMAKNLNAEITVITVVDDKPMLAATIPFTVIEDYKGAMEKIANEALQKAIEYSQGEGMEIKTTLKHGHPADTICSFAEKNEFDLVVIGSRGLGKIERLILGSVSNHIANCAKTNVLIVK